jgi:hypothetical protein
METHQENEGVYDALLDLDHDKVSRPSRVFVKKLKLESKAKRSEPDVLKLRTREGQTECVEA